MLPGFANLVIFQLVSSKLHGQNSDSNVLRTEWEVGNCRCGSKAVGKLSSWWMRKGTQSRAHTESSYLLLRSAFKERNWTRACSPAKAKEKKDFPGLTDKEYNYANL